MRDPENIRAVEKAIAPEMMGFIFWEGSKRFVKEVPTYLPNCTRVGVFVNPLEEDVIQKTKDFALNAIQLHGTESVAFCSHIKELTGLPVIKAFSINSVNDLTNTATYDGIATLFLFDTKCKYVGGSGKKFNWDILQHYKGDTPFLLSGGIGPGDEDMIRRWRHPRWIGIDLNSRFETKFALKDTSALAKFVKGLTPPLSKGEGENRPIVIINRI